MIGGSKMFEHHKKESPIISLAGVGGGPASYIFYSASGGGNEVKEISRSLRFNGEDSSNLPKLARNGTAGDQRTWTFSTWLKRGTTGSREQIFSAAGSHNTYIEFQDDQLMIEDYGGGVNFKVQLKRVFRDPSAWYHIVVVVDTTINSPASDRVKIYVNGRRETEFQGTPTYPSENYDTSVNDTGEHKLGQFPGNTNFPLKGYLADVHLVDGTAITETNGVIDAFGFFDDYDVWQPKAYSASHGNNGFNLTFSDTSSDAAIGTDSAGSNNYTPTNLVVGASPAYAIDLDGNDALLFPGPGTVSGDFTAEIFMKASSYAGIQRILSANEGSNSGEYFNMRAYNGNTEFYFKSGVSASGTNLPTNQWNHIAMTRSGSTISYYLNGSRWATDTSSDSINITTLCVGIGYGSEYFTGQVSNARFVNGQALYTGASYTVPTATLTTTSQGATASNVKLLGATTSTVTENAGTLGNANIDGDPSAIAAGVFGDVAGADVLSDSPANLTAGSGNVPTGNNVGNYCTLNPLDRQASNGELANGNLDLRQTTGAWAMYRGTMSMSSGKWYWEVTFGNDQYSMIGIIPTDYLMSSNSNYWPAQVPNCYVFYPYTGNKYDNTSLQNYASADQSGTGDTYGIALDLDAGTMTYYKNGSSLGQAHSGMRADTYAPVAALYNQSNYDSYNFGQRPFLYTPPANHLSICSKNLNPPVANSTTGFKALAYDGDGNATREITGMGHSPDFLWITQTNAGGWQHVLYDRTRGPGTSSVTKSLSTNSNRTEASGNDTNHGFVSAFGTDGFTVDKGTQSGGSYTNHLNWNYLAYSWDAGESAVTYGPSGSGADNESSNYDILTTVRANTTTGVSVLSYTGSGTNQDKIAHGLGVTPEAWILKSRTGAKEWYLYTQVYDGTVDYITINGNQGKNDSQSNAPNATSISLYGSTVNSTDDYAGYAFRSVEGFSKIGFYTGSGNQQFIPVGFTPAWVMIKRFTDNTVGQWTIYDTANSPANEVTKKLWADAAGGEEDHTNNSIDIVSNGFVLDPGSDSGNVQYTNTGSVGYFYMAFAEHPLTTARAR